jgi:nicotinate dehydrogenase subunit A
LHGRHHTAIILKTTGYFRENAMAHTFTLSVDGTSRTIVVDDPDMPLLYALRDDLGLNNPRFGCGLGQCGACTVHIDGRVTRSCITPLSSIGDRRITTLAGLGTPDNPHPIQKAWLEEQVSQCADFVAKVGDDGFWRLAQIS